VTLALAHVIQRAIDRGEIRDQAEAARMFGLTRARLTQIMDLKLLAPDLQEEILFQTAGTLVALSGQVMRSASRCVAWNNQRAILTAISPSPCQAGRRTRGR
jgi:hypothetical protein